MNTDDLTLADLKLIEQIKKNPDLKDYVIKSLKRQKKERDFHIIGLFYSDTIINDPINLQNCTALTSFKKDIKSVFDAYKKADKTYYVKTFCNQDIDWTFFGNIDMKDDEPNYSAGNCLHTYTSNLFKKSAKEWLDCNKGIIGTLSNLNLLFDTPFYNIFSIQNGD